MIYGTDCQSAISSIPQVFYNMNKMPGLQGPIVLETPVMKHYIHAKVKHH